MSQGEYPETCTLREACEVVQYGYTASSSAEQVGPKFLRITDIVPDLIDWERVPYCEIAPKQRGKYLLRHGDIVVARTGATTGYAKLLKHPPEAVFASYLVRLQVKEGIDANYIGAIVQSDAYKQFIATNIGGAAQPNANAQVLTSYPLRLPPLAKQSRIASILSAYDDLIENNTRRIAILEEMGRRIYEEWFERFRFPGHDGVRMVESELGPVPEDWRITSLGDVAENHDRRRKPLSKMQRENFKGPYPYYGAAKIFDYVREYIFDGQFVLLAEDGSVETSDGFPVLQLTDGKFWANNHTHILRGTSEASTEFLYLKLERFPIRGYITGAAQPKLTQANINRIPLLLPTKELMRQFTDLIQPLFQLRANLLRASANLRTTRDLLLPKLISGELDVSNLRASEAIAA
jgi:type I restriction enzyme, S subunit